MSTLVDFGFASQPTTPTRNNEEIINNSDKLEQELIRWLNEFKSKLEGQKTVQTAIETAYNITTSKIKELFKKQKQLIADAIASKPEEPTKSYAEVLSYPKKENKKLKHVIAIHSNNDTVKSFELKKKIKDTIDPVFHGLGVYNVHNISK